MSEWASLATDLLWRNALGTLPMVLLVAAACRWLPCRPSTRHTLWLIALLCFVSPSVLPTSRLLSDAFVPFLSSSVIESKSPLPTPDGFHTAADGGPVDSVSATNRIAYRSFEEPADDALPTVHKPLTESAVTTEIRDVKPGSTSTPSAIHPRRARTDQRLWGMLAQTSRSAGPAEGESEPLTVYQRITSDSITEAPIAEPEQPGSVTVPSPPPGRAPNRLNCHAPEPAEGDESVPADRIESPVAGTTSFPASTGESLCGGSSAEGVPAIRAFSDDFGVGDWPTGQHSSSAVSREPTLLDSITNAARIDSWRAWSVKAAAQWQAVRDLVTQLPPIPMGVWLTGAIGCAAAAAVRVGLYRRNIRATHPAPHDVRRMVAESANAVGLSRAPQVLMIRDRVSPMIWCGRRVRLILPESLWRELDDVGRRAVVCHELAHIRRRDHWVNWLQLIVTAACWWNPVVWWVRRRLNEEAELCCDAWVTWLLPNHRRAYAEALLKTREYVANQHRAAPVVGIGVMTGRAGRFARRLKMVMTERVRPKLSASGMVTALVLASAGWLTAPALSCPKTQAEKECESGKAKIEMKAKGGSLKSPALAPAIVELPNMRVLVPSETLTMTGAVAPMLVGGPAGGVSRAKKEELAARLEQLEAQIQDLAAQLDGIRDGIHGSGLAVAPGLLAGKLRVTRPPQAPAAPPAWTDTPEPPTPSARRAPRARAATPVPPGLFYTTPGPGPEAGEVVWRTYHLPEGKLEALTELMIRSDVPVLVRQADDGIALQGTQMQHETFGAFIRLIHPDGNERVETDIRRALEGTLNHSAYAAALLAEHAAAEEAAAVWAVEPDAEWAADSDEGDDDGDDSEDEADDDDDGDDDSDDEGKAAKEVSVLKDVARALMQAGLRTMEQKSQLESGVMNGAAGRSDSFSREPRKSGAGVR